MIIVSLLRVVLARWVNTNKLNIWVSNSSAISVNIQQQYDSAFRAELKFFEYFFVCLGICILLYGMNRIANLIATCNNITYSSSVLLLSHSLSLFFSLTS